MVADHATGISLSGAARAVELAPSTALRQLRSLESAGFVARRDTDGRFEPGPELLRIARALAASTSLARLAEPVLAALAADTGESAYLAEPADRSWATYTALAEGRHAIRHVSWLGHRVPRRRSAVGAALAGRVDDDGTAVRHDAVEPGITAVAAPVHDHRGRVVAAVNLVGPSFRLAGDALAEARRAVAKAAGALGPSPT